MGNWVYVARGKFHFAPPPSSVGMAPARGAGGVSTHSGGGVGALQQRRGDDALQYVTVVGPSARRHDPCSHVSAARQMCRDIGGYNYHACPCLEESMGYVSSDMAWKVHDESYGRYARISHGGNHASETETE